MKTIRSDRSKYLRRALAEALKSNEPCVRVAPRPAINALSVRSSEREDAREVRKFASAEGFGDSFHRLVDASIVSSEKFERTGEYSVDTI